MPKIAPLAVETAQSGTFSPSCGATSIVLVGIVRFYVAPAHRNRKRPGCPILALGLACKEKPGWKQNGAHQDDRGRALPHSPHRYALRLHAWRDHGFRVDHLPHSR